MAVALPTFRTPRLILRPLALSDADAIQGLFPQWEIVRYLAAQIPWPYPPDGALTFLRDLALPAMAAGREWHWAILPRTEPDRLIGVISLMDKPDDHRGFWLAPAWQGKGLMSEAIVPVTDYWFEVLSRPVLRVPKAAANIASRRISEASSMRIVRSVEKDYVSGRLLSELWEITREEWRRHRREAGA